MIDDVVICEPVRTPLGRCGGALGSLSATQLAVTAVEGLLHRTGVDPAEFGVAIFGNCYSMMEAPEFGRVVALDEHPRPDASFESLSALRPIMVRDDAQATVTAGNSSGQNDAASATPTLAVMQEWGLSETDRARVDVHGSGISLGHPVSTTDGRMLATLARELHRRDLDRGLVTMCIGGGQGLAGVFERVK